MNKLDAIVFNSHGVGQYAYTDRMPVWGETLEVHGWHIAEDGGKGTNVSVALGRLGIKTAYIGKVGNDPWGDLGELWMQKANVDTTFLYRTDEVSTGTGLILIGPDGQNTIIDGDSSSVKLTQEEVFNAIDQLEGSQLFITGYEVPQQLSIDGAKYAKLKGMQVALNSSPINRNTIDDLSFVDYLFINENELNILLDREHNHQVNLEIDLKNIKEKYNPRIVILTMGVQGSAALLDGEIIVVDPVIVSNIVNTAGAGDGFMAATIARLIKGDTLINAMQWASYYASLSITIEGTIPSYRYPDEVESFIKSKNKESNLYTE